MARRNRRPLGLALALVGMGAACFLAAGCDKAADTSSGAAPTAGMPGAPTAADVLAKLPGGQEYAAGKKVYADNNCAKCHKLGDTGGAPPAPKDGPPGGKGMSGGMSGPDLTATGAKAAHTKQWLADHVRDPKTHSPQSKMPASGPDKISDADLDALAEYLASRK